MTEQAKSRLPAIETIVETFELIDEWDERYRYVIELGKSLPALCADAYTDAYKVHGCASQVWLRTCIDDCHGTPVLTFYGDSDAHIVKGLIAVVLALFSGRPARDILNTDYEEVFMRMHLREHLTPQRSNGLAALVRRIHSDAQAALTAGPAGAA